MLKSLPPVGNPIQLASHIAPEVVFSDVFTSNEVYLYDSGTMALAAALVAIREYRSVSSPEVLLPAYACPDLISAVLYAGLTPVLVDLVPDRPWMDLGKLRQLIGPNTVAVIAAHFLGLPEHLQDIRSVLDGTDVMLVEDSAQLFPRSRTDAVWQGDMVVLSFGRGKPVSLLGGGAVISRHSSLATLLPEGVAARLESTLGLAPNWKFKLKVRAYNALLSPLGYGALKHAPFLHLGATVYKPLQRISPFDKERVAMLATNIIAYQQTNRQVQVWISEMLNATAEDLILDLPSVAAVPSTVPLLRYPVLFKDQYRRDRVHDALSRAGLGASKMYESPLPQIEGLGNILSEGDGYPTATNFSKRLLTLPCHLSVQQQHVEKMKGIWESLLYR